MDAHAALVIAIVPPWLRSIRRFVVRVLRPAAAVLAVLWALGVIPFAARVAAQNPPVRVVQNRAASLFIIQGSQAWPPITRVIARSGDGALSLVDGTNAYPLIPDAIADTDVASLTLASEIRGSVPRALWTDTASTQALEPAPQPAAAPGCPPVPVPVLGVDHTCDPPVMGGPVFRACNA